MGENEANSDKQSEITIEVVPITIVDQQLEVESSLEKPSDPRAAVANSYPKPDFSIFSPPEDAERQSKNFESPENERKGSEPDLNLYGLPFEFGSTKGKGHEKPRKRKKYEKPEFKVKSVFDSPTKYKTTTSLPNSEQIRALWLLPQEISERLINTIADIYSHVARRGGKGGDTFFVNTVVTAEYELANNLTQGIKGKNHRLKTGVNAKTIEKTIGQIEQALARKQDFEKDQKVILKIWHVWFRHQLQLCDTTIQKFSEADLARLEKDFGYFLEDREKLYLTPTKKQIILDMHPKTPEGKQSFPDTNTPKSLTKAMESSLAELLSEKEPSTPEKEEISDEILNLYQKHRETLKNGYSTVIRRKLFENSELKRKL
ncbi:MAG: hypothetical protein U1E78_09950 [Gammaproteobacteria bacterium]